jgi:hypothetical protein
MSASTRGGAAVSDGRSHRFTDSRISSVIRESVNLWLLLPAIGRQRAHGLRDRAKRLDEHQTVFWNAPAPIEMPTLPSRRGGPPTSIVMSASAEASGANLMPAGSLMRSKAYDLRRYQNAEISRARYAHSGPLRATPLAMRASRYRQKRPYRGHIRETARWFASSAQRAGTLASHAE